MDKRIILIDLDGVLNKYSGNFDNENIPAPKEGIQDFLKTLNKSFNIKIFTTRNKLQVSKWLIKHNLDNLIFDITNIKELCWLYIDDRCIKFDGNFKNLIKDINNFKPWYKS